MPHLRSSSVLRSQQRLSPNLSLRSLPSRHLPALLNLSRSISTPSLHLKYTNLSLRCRTFTTTPTMSHPPISEKEQEKKDWSATQYLKFNNERTRAVYDLISRLQPHLSSSASPRIYDFGCGPGNSTRALLNAFPTAHITGLDSSPDMLSKARTELPGVEFKQGDVSSSMDIDSTADLLFSNAVFHWLRNPSRIPTLVRLFESLKTGAVLAIQVPDNYHQPSHALMRATATTANSAWASFFADTRIADLSDTSRPDLDPIEPPSALYNALAPLAQSVDVWRTEYMHVLKDAAAIVEWVKGTGLQPYVQRIKDEAAKKVFLEEYERRLSEAYPKLEDGKVLLGYPRLFVVAVRK